ncbi:MAG TPA: hypothetical protein VHM70_06485 [Polyangiaceae bacterium]|nr:hypothetical protein [Polyangiaceae bacterium]
MNPNLHTRASIVLALIGGLACNVESSANDDQPVKIHPSANTADAGDAASSEPSVSGFVVVHSDFRTSSVSVVDVAGKILSDSLLSSGSKSPGISQALGEDVVVPSSLQAGNTIVLIDRTHNVIDWVSLDTAKVTKQVEVGTEMFASNPYDYLPISASKAYVSRYETNAKAGETDFDGGGDLLIIDPSQGKLTGSIELEAALGDDKGDVEPRPDTIVRAGNTVFTMLAAISADFVTYAESRMVSIDSAKDEVTGTLVFAGLKNCGQVVVSPDQTHLAVSCWGTWSPDVPTDAAIVLVDISGAKPKIEKTFAASKLGAQPNTVEFLSDDTLLYSTYGAMDTDGNTTINDEVRTLHLADGKISKEPVLEGAAFTIADMRCVVESGLCVVADAGPDGGVLQYLTFDAKGGVKKKTVAIPGANGLPPRYLTTFGPAQ